MSRTRGDSKQRILTFIEQHTQEYGYPPSVREICKATGLSSTSTVYAHLVGMERDGTLKRGKQTPRALSVVGSKKPEAKGDYVYIPIVGKVTAGVPIEAIENYDDFISIPRSMVGEGQHFILSIEGHSMINAGIMDGDYVVVRKQNTANNGDIIIAMIDNEATCKRFYHEDGHIRLQPENPTMAPIITNDVTVLGKVVSLYRNF